MKKVNACLLACLCSACMILAQESSKTPETKKLADEKTIRALIEQLGDDAFDVREKAHKRLAELGETALQLLQLAAKDNRDAERRERLAQLLNAITNSFFVEVRRFEKHKNWTTRVVVTPDGRYVVAALRFGALRCWNVADAKEAVVFDWSGPTASWALALSPDGKRLLVGSEDRVARVFDMKSGKLLQELRGHTGQIFGVAFLPDGKRAVTGGADRSICVWDLDSGRELRAFEKVPEDIQCLAVSPDGTVVAVGHTTGYDEPGTIRLWDLESGRVIRALPGHTKRLCSICFAQDGKTLLSSSIDKTVRLWEVATGRILKVFEGHTSGVEAAAFTSDGKRIVSVGNEGNPVAMMWDVVSGAALYQTAPTGAGLLDIVPLPDSRFCVTSGKDGVVRLWQWKR